MSFGEGTSRMKCSVNNRMGSEMQAVSLLTFRGPMGSLLKSHPSPLPHGRQSLLFVIDLERANILIFLASFTNQTWPVP